MFLSYKKPYISTNEFRHTSIGIMIGLLVVIALWSGWTTYQDYQNTITQQYQLLEVRAKQHEARLLSELRHIDIALQRIAEDMNVLHDPSVMVPFLKQYLRQLPLSKDIIITNKEGRIVASSNQNAIGFDASKREYFSEHYTHPLSDIPHISKPFKTILDYTTISVSRVLMNEKKDFAGSVVISLTFDHFDDALRPDSTKTHLAIALIDTKGYVLGRYPSQKVASLNVEGEFCFEEHRVSGEKTTHHLGHNQHENILKLAVLHEVEGFPLTIIASEYYDDVMESWSKKVVSHILSFTILILMILFLLRLIRKQEAFVQDTINSISNQIAVINHEGVITAINSSWRRFSMENSREPGEMAPGTDVGANYLAVSCNSKSKDPMNELNQVCQGIRAVLDGTSKFFTFEYPCHAPHEERWFIMSVTPLSFDKGSAVIVHSDITARKLSEIKVQNLAFYDTLTNLPNRRLLGERMVSSLAGAKRSGFFGALMVLDLDNFKTLNDTAGHAFGDLLLIEVAKRLSQAVREIDTVARLGGDEFVVILNTLHEDKAIAQEQAMMVAEKIRESLSREYHLASDEPTKPFITHRCSASIGMVLFGKEAHSHSELLRNADRAMYIAKEKGRNSIVMA